MGLLSLSQAKKVAGQIKQDLHLKDEESLRLAQELVASSEKAAKDVLKTVDRHLSKAIIRSRLVQKRDLFRARNMLRKALKKVIKKR